MTIALLALLIVLAPVIFRLAAPGAGVSAGGELAARRHWYLLSVGVALVGVYGQLFVLQRVLQLVGLEQAVGFFAAEALSWAIPVLVGLLVLVAAVSDILGSLRPKPAKKATRPAMEREIEPVAELLTEPAAERAMAAFASAQRPVARARWFIV